jgi:hypothetical protein
MFGFLDVSGTVVSLPLGFWHYDGMCGCLHGADAQAAVEPLQTCTGSEATDELKLSLTYQLGPMPRAKLADSDAAVPAEIPRL